MEQLDRTHLADQLRRAFYAAGFIIAVGSVWVLGWSRTKEAGLPDDFGNPDPDLAPIVSRAHPERLRSELRAVMADARE